MAFSHKAYIINTFVKIVRSQHYYFTYYGSWIIVSGSSTTAYYNYNLRLTQTETGRAVAGSTKGALYYAASNQEH